MADAPKTLRERLLAVQAGLKAPKGQRNSFGNYNYRNCEDILEAVKPLLSEYGLTLILNDGITHIGDRYYVQAVAKVYVSEGNGTEWEAVSASAREEETKKGMDGSQITGAASSYARKYALNGLFLIDDTKDSDTTNTHDAKAPYKLPYKPRQAPPLTPASINNDLPPLDSYEGTGPDEDTRVKTAMAVSAERVRTATVTRLGGVLQFKGISDQRMRKDILNELAKKEYGAAGVLDLDEVQANELSRKLANPKTNKEELIAMIDPFAPID